MTISESLKNLIAEQLGVEPETINPNSHFQDDFNADPLSMADLVVSIEEKFNVKVPQEDLLKFATFGDIVNFLTDNMAEV